MNTFLKIFTIIVIIIVFILSVVTVYRFVLSPDQAPAIEQTDNPAVDFMQQTITTLPEQTFVSGGTTISSDKFMNNGLTFEDPNNQGNYILVGDRSNCVSDEQCTEGFYADNYSIWYDATDSVFFIRLTDLPLRKARLDAEFFLKNRLNLSDLQLCNTKYYMSVPEYVSTEFASEHLLFSTCVGSQQL